MQIASVYLPFAMKAGGAKLMSNHHSIQKYHLRQSDRLRQLLEDGYQIVSAIQLTEDTTYGVAYLLAQHDQDEATEEHHHD